MVLQRKKHRKKRKITAHNQINRVSSLDNHYQINIVEKQHYVVIQLEGKCETEMANELQVRIDKYRLSENRQFTAFIIDFSQVTHISSTALSVIIILKKLIEQNNGLLIFCQLNDYVLKIIQMIDTMKNFRIFQTLSEAETWVLDNL